MIDEVFMESEIDWSKQALIVLNKKFPDYRAKLDPKSKQKIWRYMLSHGFYADDFSDYVGSGDEYLDWYKHTMKSAVKISGVFENSWNFNRTLVMID